MRALWQWWPRVVAAAALLALELVSVAVFYVACALCFDRLVALIAL